MSKVKERVFEDLVELAESGLGKGRVKDGWFTSKVWSLVEVSNAPGVFVYSSPSTSWTYEAEKLRTDQRLRESIKRTAVGRQLPKVGEHVSVSFKSEDEQRGQAVGPVTVIDHEVYDKDFVVAKSRDDGSMGVPFGYVPQGQHQLGWHPLSMARKVARHYGVELEEF